MADGGKAATKVSVIIPIYNAEAYLRQCLDSVLGQTLQEIELICVNDGSTDKSPEILKEYAEKDSRIVLIHQENAGAGSARNKGLRIAKSPYIGFVDADDFIVSTMYEKMYGTIKNNNVDLVHCEAFFCYEHKLPKAGYPDYEELFSHESGKHENKKLQIIDGVLWNKLFSRDTIINYNIFFPEGMSSVEDTYFTWCYFAVTKTTFFLTERLYYYFVRPGTVSAANYEKTIGKRQKEYLECIFHFYAFLMSNNVFQDFRFAFWQRFAENINLFFSIGNKELSDNYALPMLKEFLKDKDLFEFADYKYSILHLIKDDQTVGYARVDSNIPDNNNQESNEVVSNDAADAVMVAEPIRNDEASKTYFKAMLRKAQLKWHSDINLRFDDQKLRFDDMNTRIYIQNAKIGELGSKIGELSSKIECLEKKIDNLHVRLFWEHSGKR